MGFGPTCWPLVVSTNIIRRIIQISGATPSQYRCEEDPLTDNLVYPSELASPIIGTGIFPKEAIPAERIGTEEEMAGTILYITSRAGAYLNGNVLVTDGGRLSVTPSTY